MHFSNPVSLQAHSLVKRYGRLTAVDGLSFDVRPGIVTGFLGPNGAGKSTTLRMFLGLDKPTSGAATVGGLRLAETPHPMRVVGAMLVAVGPSAVDGEGLLGKVVLPAFVAPVLAFVVAGLGILLAYRLVGHLRPGPVSRGYRLGQIASGSMLALAHGTNDAQKTMGVITLALVAHGNLPAVDPSVPTWVVASSAAAIALGTYTGGWRIIRTMGSKIIKMDAAQGFTAQGSGAAVILAATHVGFPLSTTHVISGGVVGAGAAKRLSAVKWGVAGNMAVAWVLTSPAAGLMGGVAYGISWAVGGGTAGPVVVCLLLLIAMALMFRSRSTPPPLASEAAA